jgi:hypothetical protein
LVAGPRVAVSLGSLSQGFSIPELTRAKRPGAVRKIVCFSPAGDLVGGAVVVAIGVDACRHLKGRPENLAIATLPLLLGLHQVDETLVWWGLQGHVSREVGHVATWIYLLFALIVLPILVPALLAVFEHSPRRRWRYAPFGALGAFVSGVLLEAMLVGHPAARLGAYHLVYSIGLQHGVVFIGLYIVATCGPLLASGRRVLVWFGGANLVAVVVLALLCASGFTSLWCFYAALLSGAIALHLRLRQPREDRVAAPRVTYTESVPS